MRLLRDHLIINHRGFVKPVRNALMTMGLSIVDEAWQPSEELLSRSLACHVWFYDCLRHPWKIFRLKQRLQRHGVPLLAWNRDAPHYLNRRPWRLDLLDRFKLLDIYASHSLIDRRRFAPTVLYLPNAADQESYHLAGETEIVFNRLRNPDTYRYDVSFFGGMTGARYKEDEDRERFFAALSQRLSALGLRFIFCEAAEMSVSEQIRLIQESRINLNYGARCEYRASRASGLPERCYGIPACGGFLLCDRRTHARDDFTPGINWAEFDGLDDCVDKIVYWLAHFELARDLAERCHRHVMTQHTYAHRAQTLHQALLDWHRQHKDAT
ncbi:MAG TPA: glycosyltransferase [Accumulibacter sp.]|nr:glycosyltransferase [Accumulibacter sp.]HMW17544.1 glycosyltransferase [Accumulibacter sp.]HMX22411.1 glycosyltransferase [Accumulibacter sp.]HMY05998.1 glycosyltransferase [Accumulibacter sp.]HNC17622.1 glycosyltransferase [Accumulibacter sp.]